MHSVSHPVIHNAIWRLKLMLIILHMMFNAVSSFHLGLLCALYLDFKYIYDSKDLRHTFVKVAFLSSRTNICINLLNFFSVVSLSLPGRAGW